MKSFNYLRAVCLGFLVAAILFISLVVYQMGAPTPTSRWIDELNTLKSTYAQSIKIPKLLFVSGSNTLYGVSCQMITQETDIPCVNTALTQELGLDYILTHARRLAKPGDTIILPLEYQLYLADRTPSELSIDYVLAYDPDYLQFADLFTKINYIGGVSLPRLTAGILAKVTGKIPRSGSYENRINQNGDITDNDRLTEKEYRLIERFQPFNLNEYQLRSYAQKTIGEFMQWCDRHQVRAIATWPSTVYFEEYQQPGAQAFFESIKNLYQTLNVPILGTPEEFMYEKSLFFNSVYHLSDRGRTQRTRQIMDFFRVKSSWYPGTSDNLVRITTKVAEIVHSRR